MERQIVLTEKGIQGDRKPKSRNASTLKRICFAACVALCIWVSELVLPYQTYTDNTSSFFLFQTS